MTNSAAYNQFCESLEMAKELLKIENSYKNPPRLHEQKAVQGLRGSVAVLVVAAFESYLRQMIEERLAELSAKHHHLHLERLPDNMRVTHVYNSLERAMKGPLYQDPPPKIQRLVDIDRICRVLISGDISASVFADTGGNPSSKNLKSLFKSLDLIDITSRIKLRFDKKWGKPTAQTFIDDKLQEIVNRRHIVAHTADALSISRTDLKESLKFLNILAELLDKELENHVKQLIKACS